MTDEGIPVVPLKDDAGVAPGMLIPLSKIEHEYALPDPLPDPRGWKVALPDGRRVGEVSDLVVDTDRLVVKYVEVKVDTDVAGDDDIYRLVPVSAARLDDDRELVVIDRLPGISIADTPRHDREAPTVEQERALRTQYEPAVGAGGGSDRGLFDQEHFWGARGAGRRSGPSLVRRGRAAPDDDVAEVVVVEEVVVDGVTTPTTIRPGRDSNAERSERRE
jgi:hypothetical protein